MTSLGRIASTRAALTGSLIVTSLLLWAQRDSGSCHLSVADSLSVFSKLVSDGKVTCDDFPLAAMGTPEYDFTDSSLLQIPEFDAAFFGKRGYFIHVFEETLALAKRGTERVLKLRANVDGFPNPVFFEVTRYSPPNSRAVVKYAGEEL